MLWTCPRRSRAVALTLGAVLLPSACGSPTSPEDPLAALEREIRVAMDAARATARVSGCATVDQCAAAPVGAKPCGGPETHLVYCRSATDEAGLAALLARYAALRREYNALTGRVSDCMFVGPPQLALSGDTCVAVSR